MLIALALFLVSVSSYADELNYYQAAVPVKNQSPDERSKAAGVGLVQVLVRMSGSTTVGNSEAVKARSAAALSYVQQFRYGTLEDPALLAQGYSSLLYLTYSPLVVKEILRAPLKFWPVNRPTVLAWLVEDNVELGKRLVNAAQAEELVKGMQKAALERGVPLTLPLLDLQDQFALSAEQVWNLDEDAVRDASRRYGADIILVGKYTLTSSGQTWANWQYLHEQSTRVYDSRVDTAGEAGYLVLGQVADYLAERYAIEAGLESRGSISVLVHQIDSYGDYRGLLDFFGNLGSVKSVQVQQQIEDVLYLRVQSDATAEQFARALQLGNRLVVMRPADADEVPAWERAAPGSPSNPLLYKWMGR